MATKSASIKAIELVRSVFESVQGNLGLLKFSIDSLTPTNGTATEESKKWDVVCSFLENLASNTLSKYKASVDLNTNTVSVARINGIPNPKLEGNWTLTKNEKEEQDKNK